MTPLTATGPHVLLVDDQIDTLRPLVEMLRQEGFRLSLAFDGDQGYLRAQALQPDIILLDVCMPRLDGFSTCRLLKGNPATRRIPVVFLTSASALPDRLEGLSIGGVDYILKPFAPEEVLARLRVHLRQAPARPDGPPTFAAPRRRATDRLADTPRRRATDLRPEPPPADLDQVLVNAARRYLDEHLREPPSLAALAQTLGTYDKRLSQAFRRQLGLTVFAFLRQRRLERAQAMLRDSHLPISAIAEELGFSNVGNFATAFRQQTGQTPKAFREKTRALADTPAVAEPSVAQPSGLVEAAHTPPA